MTSHLPGLVGDPHRADPAGWSAFAPMSPDVAVVAGRVDLDRQVLSSSVFVQTVPRNSRSVVVRVREEFTA